MNIHIIIANDVCLDNKQLTITISIEIISNDIVTRIQHEVHIYSTSADMFKNHGWPFTIKCNVNSSIKSWPRAEPHDAIFNSSKLRI